MGLEFGFYETFNLVLQSNFLFPSVEETERRNVDSAINRLTISEPCQECVFAIVPRMRETLILSADAVECKGNPITSLIDKEVRKSATSFEIAAGKDELLSNDGVVIAFNADDQPQVRPAFIPFKLFDDAVQKFALGLGGAEQFQPLVEKHSTPVTGVFRNKTTQVTAISTLDYNAKDAIFTDPADKVSMVFKALSTEPKLEV